jgi:hypothetical protein
MNLAILISRFVLVAVVLAALVQPGLVQAQQQQQRQQQQQLLQQQQQQPLPREDNRWGGVAHQPTESEVLQQEKAAGISPSQQQQNSANQDVEQLYQSLINNKPGGATH